MVLSVRGSDAQFLELLCVLRDAEGAGVIELREWCDEDGRRHLRFEADIPVVPYTRMTRRTRFAPTQKGKRAADYVAFVASTRQVICNLMRSQSLDPFGKVAIGVHFEFNLNRRRFNRVDLSNLLKSVEDSANSALWIDDRWIVMCHGFKRVAEEGFSIDAWEMIGGQDVR